MINDRIRAALYSADFYLSKAEDSNLTRAVEELRFVIGELTGEKSDDSSPASFEETDETAHVEAYIQYEYERLEEQRFAAARRGANAVREMAIAALRKVGKLR